MMVLHLSAPKITTKVPENARNVKIRCSRKTVQVVKMSILIFFHTYTHNEQFSTLSSSFITFGLNQMGLKKQTLKWIQTEQSFYHVKDGYLQ